MHLFFTNAPEAYDYSYVETVAHVPNSDFRLIRVSDLGRFEGFQKPRYASGFHIAFRTDDFEVDMYNLPSAEELMAA